MPSKAIVDVTPAITDREVLDLLRKRYIKRKQGDGYEGGIFLDEVTYGGAGGPRCDAVFVGFTYTTGRIMTGHEIKCSRSDWLRELKQPHKADAWAEACHRFYLVTTGEDICRVDDGELPIDWGLLVAERTKNGKQVRLRRVVEAVLRTDHTPPWPAMLAVMSRTDSYVRRQAANDLSKRLEFERERLGTNARAVAGVNHLQRRAEEAERQLGLIRDAMGIDTPWTTIDRYVPVLAEFVKAGMSVEGAYERLRRTSTDGVRQSLDALDAAVAELNALKG